MSVRTTAELQAKLREEEAERLAMVERRLSWNREGITERELARRIGWPVGVGSALRELRRQHRAHQLGDRWFHGPAVVAPTRRPYSKGVRELVLGDVAAHPGTSAGEVAARLRCSSSQVSSALQLLRQDGRVTVAGQRRAARWTVSLAHALPPADPALHAEHHSPEPPHLVGPWSPEAALTSLLDALGVPALPDLRARVDVCLVRLGGAT